MVGDAVTFKWANASMAQVAVNAVVVAEVGILRLVVKRTLI